jgi:glycosyltransferase involved in cell wall biosynthesis
VQINPGIPKLNIREKFESRKTLRLNSSDFTIGWMGRLEQIKRPNLLIDIAKLIPEVNFIVAGTGSLEKILRQSSPPNISYVGWISPEVFWSACDLAISTSENEAQPFALIEAGLAGLPLIAFDVGGIDGVVVEQRNGYLCDTILEISEKIILLKSDMPKRIRYGEFSKTHMSKNFNVETFRDKHRELFYQIERKKR